MSEAVVFEGRERVRMFGLIAARHRLHFELKTGRQMYRQSLLVQLRAAGISDTRDRWTALYDVNQAIREAGGLPDKESLALQKKLGKSYPPKAREEKW